MAPSELEARLVVLEREVARLKTRVEGTGRTGAPWWERIAGSFAHDPAHEKAMKLGREYRASLRSGGTDKRELVSGPPRPPLRSGRAPAPAASGCLP